MLCCAEVAAAIDPVPAHTAGFDAFTHLPYALNRCRPLWHATLISHATTMSSGAASLATARSNRLSALHEEQHYVCAHLSKQLQATTRPCLCPVLLLNLFNQQLPGAQSWYPKVRPAACTRKLCLLHLIPGSITNCFSAAWEQSTVPAPTCVLPQ